MKKWRLGLTLTLQSATACAANWHPAPLYPALAWRQTPDVRKEGKPCAPPPPAVRDINTISKYGEDNDNSSTIVDDDAEQQYLADTAPITAFAKEVTKRSDRFIEGKASGYFDAACALEWLDAWARDGAFLGVVNRQGESVRKWELATFATTYIKIADAALLDRAKMKRVREWIREVAVAARSDFSRNTDLKSRRNNHLYWAAWGVTAAGIATGDHSLFAWGIGQYRFALDQIQEDGTLPLELERRSRAASYHMYALQPLVMIAEAGETNGIEMYSMKENRLQKLIDLNLTALSDMSVIGRLNGHHQEDLYSEASLSWMEPYYARFQDPRVLPWLAKHRPFGARRTGGNMTALYVRPVRERR